MKKQKYRFSLTRVKSVKIKYNTRLTDTGEYYDIYGYNSTELITAEIVGNIYFNLSDDFLGNAITVATFYDNALLGINNYYLVTENTRQFPIDTHTSYIISWNTKVFEPALCSFMYFDTQYTHPAFSKISIDKTRDSNSMNWSTVLKSDILFKAGTFDYVDSLTAIDALIFRIERYDYAQQSYYTAYKSLPFTKANCTFDYDRKQVSVDFSTLSYNTYLNDKLNMVINIAKNGYKHELLDFNIPAMMQIYVDGSETITNIVGGSATEVDISYEETPEDFSTLDIAIMSDQLWLADFKRIEYLRLRRFFRLVGRIAEIQIVGGNYMETGSNIIYSPAGFYYATTSDNQIGISYSPTNNILTFNSDTTNFYLYFDKVSRLLYVKNKSDDAIIYVSTHTIDVNCLLSPMFSIAGVQLANVNDNTDRCAVSMHNVFNVFCRILTTKSVEYSDSSDVETKKLYASDFAYTGIAYKYAVNYLEPTHNEHYGLYIGETQKNVNLAKPVPYQFYFINLKCSGLEQLTDSGLGASGVEGYYTYKNKQGSSISKHFIPIGAYFWSGVSFYATLSDYFIANMSQWYNLVKERCFFTVGTAIKKILQEVAPNIKFAETSEFSTILYNEQYFSISNLNSVIRPNIYLTHVSNIQAGIFTYEAQTVNLTLGKIFNMLRDAFQIYYFVDDDGKLHLEHISWFYGLGRLGLIQYDTTTVKDQYTKVILSHGQGKISANNSYLYSALRITADSEEALPLFKPYEIKCLEEPCSLLDIKDIQLGDFKTDIDYLYASMGERSDGIALLIADKTKNLKPIITYTAVNRCDLVGLNNYPYTLWPTNYKASSFSLFYYYKWNFASLITDNCVFEPEERARYNEEEIQVPVDADIDMLKLIHTRFGDGFILNYSIDLDSRYATLKLLHKG